MYWLLNGLPNKQEFPLNMLQTIHVQFSQKSPTVVYL